MTKAELGGSHELSHLRSNQQTLSLILLSVDYATLLQIIQDFTEKNSLY